MRDKDPVPNIKEPKENEDSARFGDEEVIIYESVEHTSEENPRAVGGKSIIGLINHAAGKIKALIAMADKKIMYLFMDVTESLDQYTSDKLNSIFFNINKPATREENIIVDQINKFTIRFSNLIVNILNRLAKPKQEDLAEPATTSERQKRLHKLAQKEQRSKMVVSLSAVLSSILIFASLIIVFSGFCRLSGSYLKNRPSLLPDLISMLPSLLFNLLVEIIISFIFGEKIR